MASPKGVLVVTASTVEGLKIKKYLKPISAHIVAGTNLFSDLLGGISDVFGGRSNTYQKQLTSLYNEAIEQIKYSAFEMGANCIIGFSIDMDEISGQGKSMFMLTAIGTAVVLEKEIVEDSNLINVNNKLANVGLDKINLLKTRLAILKKANEKRFEPSDETWNFIIENQIEEMYPFLTATLGELLRFDEATPGRSTTFFTQYVQYINSLPEKSSHALLYDSIMNVQNETLALKLSEIIKQLNLLDIDRSIAILKSDDFSIKKRGIRIITYDKLFYNRKDMEDLHRIATYIQENFVERGTRTTKKQLLSSKEKEVWTCECGKTMDIDSYCISCENDIYGFKKNEPKPIAVVEYLQNKAKLIAEFVV